MGRNRYTGKVNKEQAEMMELANEQLHLLVNSMELAGEDLTGGAEEQIFDHRDQKKRKR